LYQWFTAHYMVLKDFAGPVSAFLASITAAVITFSFARSQLRIAKSQRDIALDRLKFNLFKRRYEIYEATKNLLADVVVIHDMKCDTTKIREFYIILDEARFYFPDDTCVLLREVHNKCELMFTILGKRSNVNDESEEWRTLGDTLAASQTALKAIYAVLPDKFERDLRSPNLPNRHRETTRTDRAVYVTPHRANVHACPVIRPGPELDFGQF
jgi:hypothetical protein